MRVEQLMSLSNEDLAREFHKEQERVYEARQHRIKALETIVGLYKKCCEFSERLSLLPHEVMEADNVLSLHTPDANLQEALNPTIYAKLRQAEPVMDELFPEMASESEAKKFRYVLKLCNKTIRAEFLVPIWKRQIENFKNKTPDDMEIQDPSLKVLTKWGSDPGKDTSRLYGRELAGVIWSPFIFRRHIPRKFRENLKSGVDLSYGNVTTVVTGLLKLGKDNPWFALDSQLFSDKPTPEERWKDMYDGFDGWRYLEFEDYAKVGYYYTKRDELAFSEGATKEDLITESEKILAMSLDEVLDSARAEYRADGNHKASSDLGHTDGLGAETFSAFGPKA